ncbi:MAG: penicillin-binding protein activator LpoB [Phycisphaerales bacterium]|nr:penicillin-binding protein activator LpoB [Phycisphaerales bacterium]
MKSAWAMVAAGVVALGAGGPAGCADGNWNVKRHDPKEVRDLDYRFDEDDAREVANAMIADCLSRPWIDRWEAGHDGKRPLIVVGNVANNTQDYINTELFTDPIQKELLNSGRVRVKAQKDLRQELRDERLDTKFNDPATVKAIAKEVNADFMLVGRVADNKERSNDGRRVISYYKVTLELIDIETAEKTWIGDHDIEKTAAR